jgi:hypothetical protein
MNGQSQDSTTDFSICPHWMMTARKTKDKMVGDRNRPLGLILEWKMMMMMMSHSLSVYPDFLRPP